jgi:hypothetical protein
MTFVPGYKHDIFVSYAHVDDLTDRKDDLGWVKTLVERLKIRLAQLLGRQDNFSLWLDDQLAHHVNITPEILGTIAQTATLIVIYSPAYLLSPWCGRERERFLKLVQERRGDNARVFLVERDKVELEERPSEFGDLLGFKFWTQDQSGRARILGVSRSTRDDDDYYDRLEQLARELTKKLKDLKKASEPEATTTTTVTVASTTTVTAATATAPDVPKSEPGGTMTVYLAEATDDLDSLRTKLNRNLQQRKLRIIPDVWYPPDPEAFRKAVEDGLNEADLFVQLLSAAPGRKPPGLEDGYVGFQHRRAKELGLPILQWRSPALDVPSVERDVEDEEHRKLLLGASVETVDIEDFSREIFQQAERAKKERQQVPPPGAFVFVNADMVHDDPLITNELCRYFEEQGIEYALPIQAGEAEEIQIREDREANLVKCDGMIVVYGRVNKAWVRGQLRDFNELALTRRKKARALAIYHGPPRPKDPLGVFHRNLLTIDCTAGMQEARLRPFLEALQAEVVA